MLHNLTIGGSGSGKTALNKILCSGLRARGFTCGVLDPLRDQGWNAHYQTHDPDSMYRWLLQRPATDKVALFWDECGLAVDRQDKRYDRLATTGRHMGVRLYMIAHLFTHTTPTVRNMARERWVFNCTGDDAKLLARETGKRELLAAPNLPPLHFYRCRPFQPLQVGEIKFKRKAEIFLRAA